jgi:hypothetical protein
MTLPLVRELKDSFKELGIPSVHTSLEVKIRQSPGCVACRNELLESEEKPGQLTGGTFWTVSPKYQFDLLARDIPKIADSLSLSIGIEHIYLSYVAKLTASPYQPTLSDELFWYAIENGFRLSSSGWDRIALLLDLVLKLEVGSHCNYKKIIDILEKLSVVETNAAFQELKSFRHSKFLELEGMVGQGLRHEATHLISTNTRFMTEILERFSPQHLETQMTPEKAHELLISHYRYYVAGINQALNLIDTYPTNS